MPKLTHFLPQLLLVSSASFFLVYYLSWRKRLKSLSSDLASSFNKALPSHSDILAKGASDVFLPLSMARIPNDILLEELNGNISQEHLQMLMAIHRNLERVEELIKTIHSENATARTQIGPLHLPSFAAEVFDVFDYMAKSRNIHFRYTLDLQPNTELLLIDRLKFEKILINLLLNAFVNTQQNGSISLQIRTIQSYEKQIHLQCTISDSGPALSKADLLHPEFWGYRKSKKKTNGTADYSLRLAVELAKSMGGGLNAVRQDSSDGATFTFSIHCIKGDTNTVPKLQMPIHEEYIVPLPDNPIGEMHIVEANFEMAAWLKVCLNGYFKVNIYTSAREFLEFIAQNTIAKEIGIDIILFDLLLPDMDGSELFSNIKQNSFLKNIPVITFSTNWLPHIRDKALTLGVDDYITGPLSVNELRLRTLNAIRRSKKYPDKVPIQYPYAKGTSIQISEQILQTIPSDRKPWMVQLIKLIEENLQDEQMSIPFLAKNMAVSKRQLFRIVRETSGLSPNQLVQQIRLDRAHQLLKNQSNLSVTDVAYTVGMQNPSYFTTAFKKRFQKNPSKVRANKP